MKKLFALLLALCLLCAAASAPAEEDYSGTWYLVRSEMNGMVVDLGEYISMTFTLNADGSAEFRMSVYGEEDSYSGSWSAGSGFISFSDETGETITAVPVNGELTLEMDGIMMYMSRSEPEAVNYTLPAAVAAASLQDFNGAWKTCKFITGGMVITVSESSPDSVTCLNIQNGKVIEVSYDEAGNENAMEYETSELVNGSLVCSASVEGIPFTMVFSLLEDGTLSGALDLEGTDLTYVYELVDSDAPLDNTYNGPMI